MPGAMRKFASAIVAGVVASGATMEGPDATTIRAKPTLTDDLLNNFIVVPEHNLLFCFIQKVGCMNFNDLFRRVRSKYDPKQAEGSVWEKNTPSQHNLEKADLEDIMVNDTWHKAMFWRNPVERFASAWQSKCSGYGDIDGYKHCKSQFGVPDVTFNSAIDFVWQADYASARKGMNTFDDSRWNVHFKQMGHFCGGLQGTLEYYDTVEELGAATSRAKVQKLLKTVGVDVGTIDTFEKLFPPPGPDLSALTGASADSNQGPHNTNTAEKKAMLFPATQPWLESIVVDHFRSDFELFTPGSGALHQGAPESWKWPLADFLRPQKKP